MSDGSEQRNADWVAYNHYSDELDRRDFSNTEAYDKAILTLSSTGLALSIAMVKLFGADVELNSIPSLKLSWGLFFIAISSTVASFLVANRFIEDSRDDAYKIYIDGVDRNSLKPSVWAGRLKVLTRTAGFTFGLALVCVLFFAVDNVGNIQQKDSIIDNEKSSIQAMSLEGLGTPVMRATQSGIARVEARSEVQVSIKHQVSPVTTQTSFNTSSSEKK
ncbi:MAG: hypothetical protein ACJAW8_002035 [Oleispira sp.]|jgi:hypothetical protein